MGKYFDPYKDPGEEQVSNSDIRPVGEKLSRFDGMLQEVDPVANQHDFGEDED